MINSNPFRSRQIESLKDINRRDLLHAYYLRDPKKKIIADAVEEGLRDALAIEIEGFHPSPDDLVYEMYGVMDEDLSDLLMYVYRKLKIKVNQRNVPIDYNKFSIRDLINVISEDYVSGIPREIEEDPSR